MVNEKIRYFQNGRRDDVISLPGWLKVKMETAEPYGVMRCLIECIELCLMAKEKFPRAAHVRKRELYLRF